MGFMGIFFGGIFLGIRLPCGSPFGPCLGINLLLLRLRAFRVLGFDLALFPFQGVHERLQLDNLFSERDRNGLEIPHVYVGHPCAAL